MSTPIETNTEELQEILNTVYNLPMAGGGSSEPDLVIQFDDPNWDGVKTDYSQFTFDSAEVVNTFNSLYISILFILFKYKVKIIINKSVDNSAAGSLKFKIAFGWG